MEGPFQRLMRSQADGMSPHELQRAVGALRPASHTTPDPVRLQGLLVLQVQ